MKKDFSLKIITDTTETIIPNFSDYFYNENYNLSANMLFFYTKRLFDCEIPFKVEFYYKRF